ncbi:uncharacterized protein PG986_010754 [Apiospora aurea]|uniref:Uncharacterized protein n=1 Tax=Apiospora aurea TaxID=335848 RepID=A0ABR1Q4F9_9PEZI
MVPLPITPPLSHPFSLSQHDTSKERVVPGKRQGEATPSRTDAPSQRFRGCLCLPSVAVLSGTIVVLVDTPCLASLASLECTSSLTGLNSTTVVLRGPAALTVLAGSVVVLSSPFLPVLSGAIVRVEPVVVVLGSASSLATLGGTSGLSVRSSAAVVLGSTTLSDLVGTPVVLGDALVAGPHVSIKMGFETSRLTGEARWRWPKRQLRGQGLG